MSNYPEHDKLRAIKLNSSQDIGVFLEQLFSSNIIRWTAHGRRVCKGASIYNLLEMYFNIDSQKLNDEKELMLKELMKRKR